MTAPFTDVLVRGDVTAIRTWSDDPNGPMFLHAYVTDQRCVKCRVQLIDDDRGGLYDAVTDDGEPHECLMCPGCDANKYEPCQCPDHTPEEPS